MSHNQPPPQVPQEPDPAGSTQMFQAFVQGGDGGGRAGRGRAGDAVPGPRISVGAVVGVVVAVAVLVGVAWLALA